MEKKRVYAFDFDGTLTTRDTLLEFIRFARGGGAFFLGMLRQSPWLVLMKLGLYSNGKAKERVFKHFFGGMRIEDFDAICGKFAQEKQSLLRPKGQEKMREAIEEGADVFVVSASISNWVCAFFRQLPTGKGRLYVLGTQIETKEGRVTGRFLTPNCYGQEKVERIKTVLADRDRYEIIAFGDSRGDKEMLDYADERYYKPFRKNG